jgi:hypothetical protein
MQYCKACNAEHLLSEFETYKVRDEVRHRLECKAARQQRRKASVQEAAKVDPESVPKPEQCAKCGDKPPHATFKWRGDLKKGSWRPVCNRCSDVSLAGITHSQAYRARQKGVDAEGFRARNAATHRAWVQRNPERMENYKQTVQAAKSDSSKRFNAIRTYVRSKHGEEAANDMIVLEDAGAMQLKLSAPCHYCSHVPQPGAALNGLDRVDPRGKYSDSNTVSCCGVCNSMKNAFSADEFLQGVRDMVAFRDLDVALCAHEPAPTALGGTAARRNAKKDKSNHLSADDRIDLWCDLCYLCGRAPAFGIDRLDAAKPYTPDNCRSCCTLCNFMKKDWTLSEFLGHVARIYRHTAMWVLSDTANVLSTVNGPRRPVALLGKNGEPLIAFPSSGCAANVLGFLASAVTSDAVEQGGRPCGLRWREVPVALYKAQRISRETCIDHIMMAMAGLRG